MVRGRDGAGNVTMEPAGMVRKAVVQGLSRLGTPWQAASRPQQCTDTGSRHRAHHGPRVQEPTALPREDRAWFSGWEGGDAYMKCYGSSKMGAPQRLQWFGLQAPSWGRCGLKKEAMSETQKPAKALRPLKMPGSQAGHKEPRAGGQGEEAQRRAWQSQHNFAQGPHGLWFLGPRWAGSMCRGPLLPTHPGALCLRLPCHPAPAHPPRSSAAPPPAAVASSSCLW